MRRSKGTVLLWRARTAPAPAKLARFTAVWLPERMLAPQIIERLRGRGMAAFEYTSADDDGMLLRWIRDEFPGARITIER